MICDCDGKYESIRNVLDRLLSRHLRENDANRIKIYAQWRLSMR